MLILAIVGAFAYFSRREPADQQSAAKAKAPVKRMVESRHPALDQLAKLFELADTYRGKPVAFSALQTICEIAALPDCPQSTGTAFKQAADRIVEDHIGDTRLVGTLITTV